MNAPCRHHTVRSDQGDHREAGLTQWHTQLRRLRLLVEHADELTPSAFVKRVHEALPELRMAAMGAIIYIYINSGPKEE